MTELLLIDNDINYIYIIKNELEQIIGGYHVTIVSNKQDGILTWRNERSDIVLYNADMLEEKRYNIPKTIRMEDKDIIILCMLSNSSLNEMIAGFNNGIDCIIKKPFIPMELNICIQSLLRIKNRGHHKDTTFLGEDKNYNLGTKLCLLSDKSGQNIKLTHSEMKILEMIKANTEHITYRKELITKVCLKKDVDDVYASRCLDVMLARLRKKLAIFKDIKIKTIKGIGITLEFSDSH